MNGEHWGTLSNNIAIAKLLELRRQIYNLRGNYIRVLGSLHHDESFPRQGRRSQSPLPAILREREREEEREKERELPAVSEYIHEEPDLSSRRNILQSFCYIIGICKVFTLGIVENVEKRSY